MVLLANRQIDLLIRNPPIGYLRINLQRNKKGEAVDYLISYLNQTAQMALGIKSDDYIGRTGSEIGAPIEKHLPGISKITSDAYLENNWIQPDTNRHFRMLTYNTPGDDEIVILLDDITELKRTEAELIAAKERAEQANKLKSAVLANKSHEIRTLLNAIVGFSDLLSSEEDPSLKNQYTELISQNSDLLLQIISDVLTWPVSNRGD